jgi:hypothetical protein
MKFFYILLSMISVFRGGVCKYHVGELVEFEEYIKYIETQIWPNLLRDIHDYQEYQIKELLRIKFEEETGQRWQQFADIVFTYLVKPRSYRWTISASRPYAYVWNVEVEIYGRDISIHELVKENFNLIDCDWLLETFSREPVVVERENNEFIEEIRMFYETGTVPERQLIRLERINPPKLDDYTGKPDTKGQTQKEKQIRIFDKKIKALERLHGGDRSRDKKKKKWKN